MFFLTRAWLRRFLNEVLGSRYKGIMNNFGIQSISLIEYMYVSKLGVFLMHFIFLFII